MTRRRNRGDETAQRLLNWSDSQKASERLAGHIVAAEGYASIDPMHPLGGPDGLVDLVCVKDNHRWTVAVYFPNGKKTLGEIKRKLKHDIPTAGRTQPVPAGIVFVTNQYLSKAERQNLIALASIEVDLFHLERISRILDSPAQYGVRLEFLDIEMSKEEQVALFSSWAEMTSTLRTELVKLSDLATQAGVIGHIPTEQVERFREIVHSLVGYPSAFFDMTSPMAQLRPPLHELAEYEAKLRSLVGGDSLFMAAGLIDRLRPPIRELEEYETRLKALVGESPFFSLGVGLVDRLRPPLQALEEYERQLERILEKQSRLRQSGVVEWNKSKQSDE